MRKVLGIMVITSLLISCQITVNMVDPTNLVAVPTIADLEQLNILEDGQEVYVEGYWMTDDGGGGVFVYCQESTASLDGGTVLPLAIIKDAGIELCQIISRLMENGLDYKVIRKNVSLVDCIKL